MDTLEFMMIDHSIEMDKTSLPKGMRNLIEELEGYDKEGDWIAYDNISECLESDAKECLIRGLITEKQFDILLKKYRGLY